MELRPLRRDLQSALGRNRDLRVRILYRELLRHGCDPLRRLVLLEPPLGHPQLRGLRPDVLTAERLPVLLERWLLRGCLHPGPRRLQLPPQRWLRGGLRDRQRQLRRLWPRVRVRKRLHERRLRGHVHLGSDLVLRHLRRHQHERRALRTLRGGVWHGPDLHGGRLRDPHGVPHGPDHVQRDLPRARDRQRQLRRLRQRVHGEPDLPERGLHHGHDELPLGSDAVLRKLRRYRDEREQLRSLRDGMRHGTVLLLRGLRHGRDVHGRLPRHRSDGAW